MSIHATLLHADTSASMGLDPAVLARAANRGELTRVATGTYIPTPDWDDLDADERHRLRVLAVARSAHAENILSHHAAAALWRIPILGRWPAAVDILCDRSTGGRSSGQIRRHCLGTDGVDVREVDGVLATTPSRTVADLARVLPFTEGVAAIDGALMLSGAGRASLEEVRRLTSHPLPRKGNRTAIAAAAFASVGAESVWESASRVAIHELGFDAPTLQKQFSWSATEHYRVDFWWADVAVAGEFDGLVKYASNRMATAGGHEALIAEKVREDRIRSQCRGFARWVASDVRYPERLARILTDAGVPRRRS